MVNVRLDVCVEDYIIKKNIDIPAPPPVPQWGEGIRVNYYDSESFNCS